MVWEFSLKLETIDLSLGVIAEFTRPFCKCQSKFGKWRMITLCGCKRGRKIGERGREITLEKKIQNKPQQKEPQNSTPCKTPLNLPILLKIKIYTSRSPFFFSMSHHRVSQSLQTNFISDDQFLINSMDIHS